MLVIVFGYLSILGLKLIHVSKRGSFTLHEAPFSTHKGQHAQHPEPSNKSWRIVLWKYNVPSNLYYKPHLSRQWTCWSLRCRWSIAYRRCSNYIFIIDLTPDFNGLAKDNCKTRREPFKLCDLVRLIFQRFTIYYGVPFLTWANRSLTHSR